jgi:hypothetical protein
MAQLAKEEAVDLFVVGTELVTTETHEPEWRALITQLRAITGSSIPYVYGANWDPGPLQVKWWDALDYIGVDAYYPLATRANSTVAELMAAWHAAPTASGPHDILGELKDLSTKLNKPLMFAEIGYTTTDACAVGNHAGGKLSMQAQANSFDAFFPPFHSYAYIISHRQTLLKLSSWPCTTSHGSPVCSSGIGRRTHTEGAGVMAVHFRLHLQASYQSR